MAETCGVDEITIDANTAAAVIIRASPFMSRSSGFSLGIAVVIRGNRCDPHDLEPSTTGFFRLSPRAQMRCFFPGP